MKKLLAIVITVAMLLSFAVVGTSAAADKWDGTIATSFESGAGTEADPYVIKTASQLAYLAAKVQAGDPATGEHYVLVSDLDLAKLEWTPIGIYIKSGNEANCSFAGSFDGQGHIISGMSVTTTDSSIFCGLFGNVETEGYLKNIVFEDCNVTADSNSAGALGGRVAAKEISSIIVKENVKINGTSSVGGVVGRLKGADAKYLVSYATVETTKADSGCFGGGISGTVGAGAKLSYSANYGSVSGIGAFHGGITGITGGDSGPGCLYNCVNFGSVAYNGEKSWFVGGISGCFAHTKNLDYVNENCLNLGNLSATFDGAYVGEITGQTRTEANISITSCYSIDIENRSFVGNEKYPYTATDLVNKTEAEIKTLADAIVAIINTNIVVPTEPAPETTEPAPETTEPAPETTEPAPETTEPAPETTAPSQGPETGDSFVIFAIVSVISVLGVAIIAKRRENN